MESERTCWICLGNENTEWVSPCVCRGTSQWVHSRCLRDWLYSDERVKPRCPQCMTNYRIVEKSSYIISFGRRYISMVEDIAPVATFFMGLGVAWCGLGVYSYYTLSFIGGPDALQYMRSFKPRTLLAILPVFPALLLASRLQVSFDNNTRTLGQNREFRPQPRPRENRIGRSPGMGGMPEVMLVRMLLDFADFASRSQTRIRTCICAS